VRSANSPTRTHDPLKTLNRPKWPSNYTPLLNICTSVHLLQAAKSEFRVCADPDNPPFTNRRGEGFEDRIAELLARSANLPLTYYWWPQRRGFVSNRSASATPAARRCCASASWPLLRFWYLSQGTISVDTVATAKAEPFCWAAITFSQTLGTALGDWVADTGGLGYEGGALVFATGLAVIAGLYFWTNVLRILLSGQPSSSRGRSAGLFVLP
jgi:hypothetical protein